MTLFRERRIETVGVRVFPATFCPIRRIGSAGVWLLLVFPVTTAAQTLRGDGEPPAVADRDACRTPEHRALDGRVGTWYQTSPDDRLQGETQVRSILGGCAVWQDWHGASGGVGSSLNAYDVAAGHWRHMWVNGVSIVLLAEGRLRDRHTMEWNVSHISLPKDEGEVERWVWSLDEPIYNRVEASEDGGETWGIVFDDRFHRWAGSLPPNSRPSVACSLELEHHALAFWTGAWSVHAGDGRRTGHGRVDLTTKGCAMREEGRTEELGRYVRLLAFDREAGVWRMLMATDRGEVRVLEGEREGHAVYWRPETTEEDEPGTPRIRWVLERRDEDSVSWSRESSRDGGRTWREAETWIYRRHR